MGLNTEIRNWIEIELQKNYHYILWRTYLWMAPLSTFYRLLNRILMEVYLDNNNALSTHYLNPTPYKRWPNAQRQLSQW